MTKNLVKIKGFSEVKVEKVKEACRKASVGPLHIFQCNPHADSLAGPQHWIHDRH